MKKIFFAIMAGAMSLILTACGGGGSGSPATSTLHVLLTDTPACGYDHVYITVDHVEISTDGYSWTSIPVDSTVSQPIDLLNLTNGALLSLGQAPLSAGTYEQVRLVLKSNGNAAPWANSVVLSSDPSTQIPLTTPSAQQSGYKIVGPFTVQAGTQADLVLDFDACKSVVVAGNSGKYLLKPVVTAMAEAVSGSVTGTTLPGAQVYAEQNGTIVNGTVADASTGNFTLYPILLSSISGGMVDVVVVPPASGTAGYDTAIIQDVPVGAATPVGTITPSAATINTASGTVMVAGSPGAANLVANQTVNSSGRTYEIVSTSTTTGSYSLPLAASGPDLGTYSTTLPIPLTPDADAADVGIYSITAMDAAGTTATLSNVDVSAGSATNQDFTLNP
jgi:hypothetical protein